MKVLLHTEFHPPLSKHARLPFHAKQISKHFKTREDLVKYALTLIGRYEHVTFLVKGSHSMHMDEIVERINKSGERTC